MYCQIKRSTRSTTHEDLHSSFRFLWYGTKTYYKTLLLKKKGVECCDLKGHDERVNEKQVMSRCHLEDENKKEVKGRLV